MTAIRSLKPAGLPGLSVAEILLLLGELFFGNTATRILKAWEGAALMLAS